MRRSRVSPRGVKVVIGSDFNRHRDEGNRDVEEMMEKFGVEDGNADGQMVVKIFFQRREEHWGEIWRGERSKHIVCKHCILEEIYDLKVQV